MNNQSGVLFSCTIMCPSKIWHSRVPNLNILEIEVELTIILQATGSYESASVSYCKDMLRSIMPYTFRIFARYPLA